MQSSSAPSEVEEDLPSLAVNKVSVSFHTSGRFCLREKTYSSCHFTTVETSDTKYGL